MTLLSLFAKPIGKKELVSKIKAELTSWRLISQQEEFCIPAIYVDFFIRDISTIVAG